MTIIIIKNGTHSINIECAGLTYLQYCPDDDIYRCEYSDWAFGLFAMLAVIALLVPIVLAIHCGIRWYHRKLDENFKPNVSRQTSYSSLYPHEVEGSSTEPNGDVLYHQPKKKQKAYYPYPAYGTYDDVSLPGSTASLYNTDTADGQENRPPHNNAHPQHEPQRIPSNPSQQQAQSSPYLSSSCPVVSSKLKGVRDALHQEGRVQEEDGPEFNSLGKSQASRDSFYDKDDFKAKLIPSFSASSTSSGSNTQSLLDDSVVGDRTKPIAPSWVQHDRDSPVDKNRILSATPPKNMVTRQDFDDYLADCVMKLPEDQRNGLFLIRNSTTVSSCKVLTLYSKSLENNASLYYFKIYLKDDGRCVLEGTESAFASINSLIDHYRENRTILPCLLTECLGKNF
ncbi:uncharacterized protein [Clytia hemisphaerica]|uniref:SH2 domain-containing protein n=1 Tax=Clytia hemisphaerica TaxID=252671 RepID=A0A7M5VBI1_9CNID